MQNGRKITIVGAGIAGLACAIAMAQRGFKVTVLEQAEAIREVGAGLQISPNGFAVLRALGLGSQVHAAAVAAQAIELRDYRASRLVMRLDLSALADWQQYLFVHRADLIEILAEAARNNGVRIRLLQKIVSLEDLGEEGVCLKTAQGGKHFAPLVIGADGMHSKIRQFVDGPSAPFFTHQVAWRATVPVPSVADKKVQVHMGPGRHVVTYPLRGGKMMNLVAVQEKTAWVAESWMHQDDPANMAAVFSDFAPKVRALMAQVNSVHQWGLFRHPVARQWHRGQAVIIGDAVHPTLPFLAQGACMALEDVWVLADCLETQTDPSLAFARYQKIRQARVERVVATATQNAKRYHLSLPPLRLAAHTALRAVGTMAPSIALSKFDWLYQHDVTRG